MSNPADNSCCVSWLSWCFPCCFPCEPCPCCDCRTEIEKYNDERITKMASDTLANAVGNTTSRPKHHKVASTDVLDGREFLKWDPQSIDKYIAERKKKLEGSK